MDWKDEMKKAMKAIATACSHNTDWTKCYLCPFYQYCNAIEKDGCGVPDEWGLIEKED